MGGIPRVCIQGTVFHQSYCVSAECTVVSDQMEQQTCCQFRVYCHQLPAGAAGIVSLQCILLYVASCCSRPVVLVEIILP
jgi:hypothetical protein